MVALASKPHLAMNPPAVFDPGEPLQSAFNPAVRKSFATKRDGMTYDAKTGRKLREYLLQDQFGNYWLTFLGYCIDMEVYQHPIDRTAHLKPISGIEAHGGITRDLMDKHRQSAFKYFDRLDKDIQQARSQAESASILL